MQYAINNMDGPIPQIHLYDYFAYLDHYISLYIFNNNDRVSYNKETSTANRKYLCSCKLKFRRSKEYDGL